MKVNKVLYLILFMFIVLMLFSSFNYAITSPIDNPDSYKGDVAISSTVSGKVGPVLGAIRNIGIITAVIATMYIGMKYIIGSADEKANYKQTLLPLIIGIIILVAGTVIPSVIYNTMNG